MRLVRLGGAIAVVVALLCLGCDSGTSIYSIGGDWSAGQIVFNYGGGVTWRLKNVVITIDTVDGMIYLSGIDNDGFLWGYSGEYQRTENRLGAENLPEITFGSEDELDLRLEFTSSNRFNGAAINWVYDGGDLTDVGATNISGRRISTAAARDLSAAASDEKAPKTAK